MRLTAALVLLFCALLAVLVWWSGAHQTFFWWLAQKQHALQTLLAAHIQALQGGEPRAFWSLIWLCAAYGFLHAAGPGHGKALVAGGAFATTATARRMVLIATAGSFAQAIVAILIVYGSLTLLAGSARGTVEAGEGWMTSLGNGVIALIGGWILARGLIGLRASHRSHGSAHACGCGHSHHPDPDAAANATSLRAGALLVLGMAARPCTGALVILIVAWKLGLMAAGAAGVLAMGCGTAAFTGLVGLLAVKGRETALVAAGDSHAARFALPLFQVLAGSAILLASGALLLASPAFSS